MSKPHDTVQPCEDSYNKGFQDGSHATGIQAQEIYIEKMKKIIETLEGKKKVIDKNYSTDEQRYPHGYNTALKDALKVVKDNI